jgi:hypothetical protein
MPTEVLQRLAEHPDVTVEIATGIEHWERGVIALSVRGDGEAAVVNRCAGSEQRYGGRLDADAVRELGSALAGLELPGRSGMTEPDDVPVKVTVTRDGETLEQGEAWYSRRYEDPRLDGLIRRYDALVGEVTAGGLP